MKVTVVAEASINLPPVRNHKKRVHRIMFDEVGYIPAEPLIKTKPKNAVRNYIWDLKHEGGRLNGSLTTDDADMLWYFGGESIVMHRSFLDLFSVKCTVKVLGESTESGKNYNRVVMVDGVKMENWGDI